MTDWPVTRARELLRIKFWVRRERIVLLIIGTRKGAIDHCSIEKATWLVTFIHGQKEKKDQNWFPEFKPRWKKWNYKRKADGEGEGLLWAQLWNLRRQYWICVQSAAQKGAVGLHRTAMKQACREKDWTQYLTSWWRMMALCSLAVIEMERCPDLWAILSQDNPRQV